MYICFLGIECVTDALLPLSTMNCLVTLVTCIQLFNSHVLAFRRVVAFSAIPCDAVGAVKAADLGIHHINSARREGYKYSLNTVTNAQEKQVSQRKWCNIWDM